MCAASDRSREQMWAESALAPHPHRLELRGSPADLSWPQMCAHCGEPASARIVVTKVFRPLPRRRAASGLRAYRVGSASIPFCARCTATHQATVQRPSATKKLLHLVLNPLIIPVAGFIWLITVFRNAFQASPMTDQGPFPEWGVLAFLAAALAWCVFLLWRTTGPTRLDPQTEITRSCDFSEDVSGFLEKERRIYALRHKPFADAMAMLNADRMWTADDQTRSRKLGFVYAVLALASLAGLVGLLKLFGV
jgi:hypothetical protein